MKNLVAVVAVLAMFPILSYKEELFKKSFLYDSILKPLKTATMATKRQHAPRRDEEQRTGKEPELRI